MKIDGKLIATTILEDLGHQVLQLAQKNITPHLAIILVSDDPASAAYVRQKQQKSELIAAKSTLYQFPKSVTQEEILLLIEKLNQDASVHGIIVQRPLPSHINGTIISERTSEKKDIDGFHINSPFSMPIAEAVVTILESIFNKHFRNQALDFRSWLNTKCIAVLGKGETGGAPIISLLRKKGIEPIILDSKTDKSILLTADIVVSAVGKPHALPPQFLKKDVILLAIGMHRGEDNKLHADYDEEEVNQIASYYTYVPGGVGPVNVAMLLQNLIQAAHLQED